MKLESSLSFQQRHRLMDGPLKMDRFGDAPSLLIKAGVTDEQLQSSYSSILSWIYFDDLCQLPLVTWCGIVLQKNNVIDPCVSAVLYPLLSVLEIQEVLLLPPPPEEVGQELDTTPSLAEVKIFLDKPSRRWSENRRLHCQDVVWGKGLWAG